MYYLFAIINNIKTTLNIIFGTTGTLLVITTIGCILSFEIRNDDDFKKMYEALFKTLKASLIICLISLTINTFIPTQKQLSFIIAAPYIVENKDVQEIGQNTLDIIKEGTEYLKESLKKE